MFFLCQTSSSGKGLKADVAFTTLSIKVRDTAFWWQFAAGQKGRFSRG
jgi:hypothetical protein